MCPAVWKKSEKMKLTLREAEMGDRKRKGGKEGKREGGRESDRQTDRQRESSQLFRSFVPVVPAFPMSWLHDQ